MSNSPLDKIIRNANLNLAVEGLISHAAPSMFSFTFTSSIFDKIHERLSGLFGGDSNVNHFPTIKPVDSKLLTWADRESYLSLGDITVNSPVGLKVSFIEYIGALENALQYVKAIESELIDGANKVVTGYLNDPSKLTSSTGIKLTGNFINANVEQASKSIAACFDKSDKSAKIKYKVAYQRNADLEAIVTRLTALQEDIAAVSSVGVKERAAVLFTNAEALSEAIDYDPLYEKVHKNVNKQLSDILYNCAQWVEFFGVYQYQVLTLSVAINDANKKLKKLSK